MHNFEFAKDGCSIVGEDHLLKMVDDNFVATIGTQRGLDGRGDGAAGIDIADDGAILCIVAKKLSVGGLVRVFALGGVYFWYPGLKRPWLGALGIESDILMCVSLYTRRDSERVEAWKLWSAFVNCLLEILSRETRRVLTPGRVAKSCGTPPPSQRTHYSYGRHRL